jgi:hypothetical protein
LYQRKEPHSSSYISNLPKFVDRVSQTYLQQCDINNFGVPFSVTANGSCMFNAVSLSLCGSQDMATELRVRTCIEMVSRKDVYTSLKIAKVVNRFEIHDQQILVSWKYNWVQQTEECGPFLWYKRQLDGENHTG